MAHDLLKGKKGIVVAGALNDMSIAWKVALEAHAQGAEIVLTNAPVAMRMGEIHNLAKLCGGAPVIRLRTPRVKKICKRCLKVPWSTSEAKWTLSCTALG